MSSGALLLALVVATQATGDDEWAEDDEPVVLEGVVRAPSTPAAVTEEAVEPLDLAGASPEQRT